MTRVASRRRRRRPSGPASRPDPGQLCPTSSSWPWSTPGPSRPKPSPPSAARPPLADYRDLLGPGRRRLDRRPHRPPPRGRRRLPRTGHRHAGREAAGQHAGRGRAARRPGPRHRAPCSRSATSSGSTPRSRRSTAADPAQVHHRRAALDLHVPLDRHRRRARPDDPRHRPGALADRTRRCGRSRPSA